MDDLPEEPKIIEVKESSFSLRLEPYTPEPETEWDCE